MENGKDIDRTRLIIGALSSLMSPTTHAHPEYPYPLINVSRTNTGPRSIFGVVSKPHFEYREREFTRTELDTQFEALGTLVPEPEKGTTEMPPGGNTWGTYGDERSTQADWEKMQAGSITIYLFLVHKYWVEDVKKVTETCWTFNRDTPSIHLCNSHNATKSERRKVLNIF